MDSRKCLIILLALACIAVFAAGCTSSKPATTTPLAPAATPAALSPAAAGTAAPAPSTTPECPDRYEKGVWNGNWDSREEGYASNHDVREVVWSDAAPVPVSFTQKCWDVTGTFKTGDCDGKLTGKIEKSTLSGTYTNVCTVAIDSTKGTFSLTMASDNQSFMGSMYKEGGYGPENGFAPSWWGKKTA
jgi:hypothetical protein